VVLFVSRARGDVCVGSDIDLCLDSEVLNLDALLAPERQLDELDLLWAVNLVLRKRA